MGQLTTNPAVLRWMRLLAERVGMSDGEIASLRAGLAAFCARHEVDPQTLLTTWLKFPELTVRRRPGSGLPPNLAVESFLIHSGVNIFGDIVCVAGQPDDLADQGAWFTRGTGQGTGRLFPEPDEA